MKKLFSIITVFIVLLAGCADLNNVTDPAVPVSTKSLIKLPPTSNSLSIATDFTTSAYIDGNIGGTIDYYFEFYDSGNNLIKIYGTLTIPQNAFSGTKNISIIASSDYAMVDFFPSPTFFNVPLKLDLTYEGINLNGINEEDIDFYYIDDASVNFLQIDKNGKEFDAQVGKLSVDDAVIEHFSRFGWGV